MDQSVPIEKPESKDRRKYILDVVIGLAICTVTIFAIQSDEGQKVARSLQRNSGTAQLRFAATPSLIIPNLYYVSIDSRWTPNQLSAWKAWTKRALSRETQSRSVVFASTYGIPWQHIEPLAAAFTLLLLGIRPTLSGHLRRAQGFARTLLSRRSKEESRIKVILDQAVSHLQERHDLAMSGQQDIVTQYKLKLRIAGDEVRSLRTMLDSTKKERDGIIVLWENSVQKINQLQTEIAGLRTERVERPEPSVQPAKSEASEVLHNDLKEGMLELMLQTLMKQRRKPDSSMEMES